MLKWSTVRNTVVMIAWLAATLFSTLGVASAEKRLPPDTPVVVAEDVTKAAECIRSVDGGPEVACPAGSVLAVRDTTYREVQTKGIKHWTVKTKDAKSDEATVLNAAQAEFAPHVVAASCTYGTRDIYQSYLYVPNVSNSTRIGFNLKYTRNSDCSVTSIQDRNRVQSVGTNGNPAYTPSNVLWLSSCVGSSCSARNFYFGTSWTYFLSVPNSSVGTQYVNKSYAQPECTIGGYYCSNPIGYYYLD